MNSTVQLLNSVGKFINCIRGINPQSSQRTEQLGNHILDALVVEVGNDGDDNSDNEIIL